MSAIGFQADIYVQNVAIRSCNGKDIYLSLNASISYKHEYKNKNTSLETAT